MSRSQRWKKPNKFGNMFLIIKESLSMNLQFDWNASFMSSLTKEMTLYRHQTNFWNILRIPKASNIIELLNNSIQQRYGIWISSYQTTRKRINQCMRLWKKNGRNDWSNWLRNQRRDLRLKSLKTLWSQQVWLNKSWQSMDWSDLSWRRLCIIFLWFGIFQENLRYFWVFWTKMNNNLNFE